MLPRLNASKSFDNGVKEEIRSAINIADIVGRHVALKPAGQNLKGLCPFHKEKTPSFTVSPAKGIYYCFGCHKGGDVFNFLMELEGLTFPEAMSLLADEAGIKLPPRSQDTRHSPQADHENEQPAIPKDDLFKINNLALDFYYRQTRRFPKAIEYFLSRGLSKEIIRDFRLGYAPPGWSSFLEFAKSKGVAGAAVAGAGLAIIKQENGSVYDRFRDRIMFPIFDTAQRPVGFAGRGLTAEVMPKYLNSPETPLYQKNKILYGFHATQQHVREKKSVIIVEGYMDFLALFQAGVKNVIATSGTAFTDTHARTLRRFTDTIFLVFDGDSAGIEAARRAIFVLAPYNFDIRVLTIPNDEDPDDFVKARGGEAFTKLLETSSIDYMRFIIDKTAKDSKADTPYGKSAAIGVLAPLAQSLSDPVVQQEFVKRVAERLSLNEDLVYRQMRQGPDAKTDTAVQRGPDEAAAYFGTIEGNFIRLLLATPSLIREARQFILPETFTDRFSAELYFSILTSFEEKSDLGTLLSKASDDSKRILSFAFANEEPVVDANEELVHTMKRLQEKFLHHKIRNITERIKNEPGNRTALLEQLKEYSLQRKALAGH